VKQLKRVYSHAEALKQCRKWLDGHPYIEPVSVSSTALAAEFASRDPEAGAIASQICLKMYPSLTLVEEGVQDTPMNSTRFAVLASASDKATGRDKTMVWFQVDNNEKPGALCNALQVFKSFDINLTNIVSRPSSSPVKQWQYVFFAEFEGHETDANVRKALDQLKSSISALNICGSFPV
jgi:chorismate mutase / prephenate dehydratase